MQRQLFSQLIRWQNSRNRKPLLIKGARQVGKSWLLEQFAKTKFPASFLFNFEKNPELHSIFQADLDPKRIIGELSLAAGKTIKPASDIVIFDEIQECPRALISLKYFSEDMSELALCCAGSLLGVKLSSESFPVGKVTFLSMYPMTFEEFLLALDEKLLLQQFRSGVKGPLPEIAHGKLWKALLEYFITGGLPEVIREYVSLRHEPVQARETTRKLQEDILTSYYKDFAKHAGKINSMHISAVMENIPMQLAANLDASVKRYRFKDVIPGRKGFSSLQGPVDWLVQAGLAIKVKVCNRAELPLETFCKNNMFKLMLFDIGLLGCMLDLPVTAIIDDDYGITKGYFAENFVAQELIASGSRSLYSWNRRNSQIEFLMVKDDRIIPLEVKAGTRTQAKSLKEYIKRYVPDEAIILSAKNRAGNDSDVVKHNPLYMAGMIHRSSF